MARKRTRLHPDLIGFEQEDTFHIPLTRQRITESALKLLNEYGLKELSMRKVAEDLHVQPASLYYHVKGKEQLLQLLADHMSSEMLWPDSSLPWQSQLSSWGEQFREVLHKYRDAAELFQATIAVSYNRLRQIERLFGIFANAGFPDPQIPWMASILKNYVVGYVGEEVRLRTFADDGDRTQEQLSEQYMKVYGQLPKDQFPHVVRLAPYTTSTDWQQEFRFGLRVLIDGFTAKLTSGQPE